MLTQTAECRCWPLDPWFSCSWLGTDNSMPCHQKQQIRVQTCLPTLSLIANNSLLLFPCGSSSQQVLFQWPPAVHPNRPLAVCPCPPACRSHPQPPRRPCWLLQIGLGAKRASKHLHRGDEGGRAEIDRHGIRPRFRSAAVFPV